MERHPMFVIALAALSLVGCEVPPTIPSYDQCAPGWIRIPAGPFQMGLNPDDPMDGIDCGLEFHYGPRYQVTLSEFCIQQTEVTVASYRACVNAGVCEHPIPSSEHAHCNYSAEPGRRERHPVNCVSWAAAQTYCQDWEGGDLPSEAQWEKAARGTDLRLFPWGNAPLTCERANYDVNQTYDEESGEGSGFGCSSTWQFTWEADHPRSGKGDSPYGVRNMVGNVAEWTLDCHDWDFYLGCSDGHCVDPVNRCDAERKVARGSAGTAWVSPPYYGSFCLVVRGDDLETTPHPAVGFRCVHSADATQLPSPW